MTNQIQLQSRTLGSDEAWGVAHSWSGISARSAAAAYRRYRAEMADGRRIHGPIEGRIRGGSSWRLVAVVGGEASEISTSLIADDIAAAAMDRRSFRWSDVAAEIEAGYLTEQ